MAENETNITNTPLVDLPPTAQPNIIDETSLGGYTGRDEFDFQTVEDALSGVYTDILPVDENFKRMIDENTDYINNYSVGGLNNARSSVPGKATSTYNPYSNQTGPDLNTPEGRLRALQRANYNTGQEKDPAPGFVDPIETSVRRSNFDRYWNHPKFAKLGWHPYVNMEEYYNDNSTLMDDMSRMSGQWMSLAGTGFTSVYRSLSDLFSDDHSYTDPDVVSAMEFADAMRIGNSTRGGFGGFTNNLMLNSAYTFGILGSIAIEEVAMLGATALSGPAAPATGAAAAVRTGHNVGKGMRAVGQFFDVYKFANATRNMMKTLNAADKSRDFYNAMKAGGKFVGDIFAPETMYALKNLRSTKNAIGNTGNLAKINRTFGGFYRDLRAVNLAMAESKMESGMVYNDQMHNLYNEYMLANDGASPDIEEFKRMDGNANKAAFATTMWNFPVIYISNRIVLDGALRGFKPMGRIMDETMSGVGGRILRNKKAIKDVYYDAGKGLRRVVNQGIKGNARMLGAGALRYMSANFAEGFQELAQESIAVGTKDYYHGLFGDPAMRGADAQMASVAAGIESQMGWAGFEVFMSGFLMGGIVQGPQKLFFQGLPNLYNRVFDSEKFNKNKQIKEDYIKSMVTTLNEANNAVMEDPGKYFDPTRLNAMAVKQLSEDMLASSYRSDVMEFMDAKNLMTFHHLYTINSLGKTAEFIDQLKSFQDMTDEELMEAFPTQRPDIKSGKMKERLGKMILNAQQMKTNYDNLNDKYVNPYDSSSYIKGSKEYALESVKEVAYNHAKMMMLYTKDTFEKALERSNQIYTELAADPIISKIAANDIAVLTNLKSLKTEMEQLGQEISLEAITEEQKKIQSIKVERLRLLKNYYDVLVDSGNWVTESREKGKGVVGISAKIVLDEKTKKPTVDVGEGVGIFDRRKIGKLKTPFEAFLKHLAETQDDFIDSEKLEETLKKIVDYKFLKGRAQDYYKAIEVLIEPGRMDELAERMAVVTLQIWENRKAAVEDRLKKYVDDTEKNEFLNQLAKIGVYPTPEQAELFLRDGQLPNDWMNEGGRVTPESDPNVWQQIQDIIKNYTKSQYTPTETTDKTDPEAKEFARFQDQVPPGDLETTPKVSEDTNTILTNTYNKRKEEKGFALTPEQWLITKEATDIINTRGLLENYYETTQVVEGGAPESFEEWLKHNQADPDVYEMINKYGLAWSDISLEGSAEEKIDTDSFLAKEKILESDPRGGGIALVRVTYIDTADNTAKKFWKVVNRKNKDITEDWVVFNLQPSYDTQDEAWKVYSLIVAQLSGDSTFEFDGRTWKKGDLIERTENGVTRVYIVTSDAKGFAHWKTPSAVPIENASTKGNFKDREGKRFQIGDWVDEGWKEHIVDFNTVAAKKQTDKKTRLRIQEPSIVFAHEMGMDTKDAEGKDEARKRMEHTLRNLTPEEMSQLEIVVMKGPNWEQMQNISPEERDKYKWGASVGYEANEQLRKGAQQYWVEIRFPQDMSEEKLKKLEEAGLKPGASRTIGYLQGPSAATLLDKNNKPINPILITPEQVQDLFITQGYTLESATNTVRNYYAMAYAIEGIIQEKLGKKKEFITTVKELDKDFRLVISPGKPNYTKEVATPFTDLEFQFADDNGTIWIVDLKNRYAPTGTTVEPSVISNLKGQISRKGEYDALNEIVNQELINQAKWIKNAGRYVAAVRMPNGTFTFIPLKGEEFTKEEHDAIALSIGAMQIETTEKNLVDSDATGKNRVAKSPTYTFDFNDNLEETMFVVGKPGETIDIRVQKSGDIYIKYTDRNRILGKGKSRKYFTTTFTMGKKFVDANGGINNMADLVKLLNAKVIAEEQDLTVAQKSNLVLAENGFRRGIPQNANPEDIIPKVTTDIQNPIRTNMRLEARLVGEAGKIQEVINTAVKPEETSTEVHTDEAISDTEWNAFVNGGNVTEERLKSLANMVINGDAMSEREVAIFTGKTAQINEIMKGMQTDASPTKTIEEHIDEEFENVTAAEKQAIADKIALETDLSDQEKLIHEAFEDEINVLASQATGTQEATDALVAADTENAKLVAEYTALKQEHDSLIVKLQNDIVQEAQKEGWSKGKKNDAIYDLMMNPPKEITDLKAKLGEISGKLKGGTALKVLTKDFDGNDTEDINEFIIWAKKNLPDFISIADLDQLGGRLATNGVTVGAFVLSLKALSGGLGINGTIYTGAKSTFRYHEAFHAVFRMLLTEQEQKQYIAQARKEAREVLRKKGISFKTALQELRNSSPLYAHMTESDLENTYYEEYLADEFEKFKQNPKSTTTASANKSLFTRIIEWIVNVFRRKSKNELTTLFENIDSGKFKSSSIQSNIFTDAINKPGPAQIALKNIRLKEEFVTRTLSDGTTKQILSNIYIPSDKADTIVSSIAMIYLNRESKIDGPYNPGQLLEATIEDYVRMYNPQRDFYKNEESGIPYENIIEDLKLYWEAFTYETVDPITGDKERKTISDIKVATAEFLEMFNIQDQDEMYNAEIFEDTQVYRTDQYDFDASMIGGYTSLPREIRMFLATTTTAKPDELGNTFLLTKGERSGNKWYEKLDDGKGGKVKKKKGVQSVGELVTEPVNYTDAYNGLLKAVTDTKDPVLLLQKMYYFGLGNPETNAVVQRIFEQIGITSREVLLGLLPQTTVRITSGERTYPTVGDPAFFQAITNAFSQFRVDYIFIQTDPNTGITHLFRANHRDDASSQTDRWASAYNRKYKKLKNSRVLTEDIVKQLDWFAGMLVDKTAKTKLVSEISDEEMYAYAAKITNTLDTYLGISLSQTYVAYSIASGLRKLTDAQESLISTFTGDIDPIERNDIIQIKDAVNVGEHLFRDQGGEGVRSRLEKIAQGNAPLDESVGSTVFRNPKGDLIYAHQMPTFHLEEIQRLNHEDVREDKLGNLYLANNFLLNSDEFKALSKSGEIRVMRIDGSRVAQIRKDELGNEINASQADMERNPGVPFGEATDQEFLADIMNIYTAYYNPAKAEAHTLKYKDEDGKTQVFTISPVFIRNIEASNTGDTVPLPVYKAVEKDSDGTTKVTDETVGRAKGSVKNEYNRIKRESNQEDGHTEDTVEGFNTPGGRAYDLHETGNMVTKRQLPSRDRSIIKTPAMKPEVAKRVISGDQQIIVRSSQAVAQINLQTGDSAVVTITSGENSKTFTMRNRGPVELSQITDMTKLMQQLGGAISDVVTKEHKKQNSFKIGNKTYYAFKYDLAQFMRGRAKQTIYEFVPEEEAGIELGLKVTPSEEVKTMADVPEEAFTKEDLLEDFSQTTGEVIGETAKLTLSVDKKGKDQGKASLANRFIGYGVKGTSTYQYEQDAKDQGVAVNYEGEIDENTIAFVSVNGNNKASDKAKDETIENARDVLEKGGTVIMDSTYDANRAWNKSGEAEVQDGIGEPSGQTSQGYNYWGKNPEAQLTEEAVAAEPLPVLIDDISSRQVRKGLLKRELPIDVSEAGVSAMKELQAMGFNSLIVGGAVRDALMGIAPKDIDIEVYGISYEELEKVLKKHGKTDIVGKEFGVIKFKDQQGNEYDFSIPRTESRSGVGHKDFKISVDPTMTAEDAAKRRDFTWNALAYDPFSKVVHDYFGGIKDLKAGVMRHTSDQFGEDPLRILRGLQFQARMGFRLDNKTKKLMRQMVEEGAMTNLSIERIAEEWMKWATKGTNPALLFSFLRDVGLMPEFGDLSKMAKTQQEAEWHPEGDVEVHTGQVMTAAVEIAEREGLTGDDRAVLLFSALLHDVAKPATTITETEGDKKGRITSRGHEEMGGAMAREILEGLGIKKAITDKVVVLIENHLQHVSIANEKVNPQKAARTLAKKLAKGGTNIQALLHLIEADMSGRAPLPKELGESGQILKALAEDVGIVETAEPDILMGRHLLALGVEAGPAMGQMLSQARQAQEDGIFSDESSAIAWAQETLLGAEAVVYGSDRSLKIQLEEKARQGLTWDEALGQIGITEEELSEIIAERMMIELQEFQISIRELNVKPKLSRDVKVGLRDGNNKETAKTRDAMDYYNLIEGEMDYNIAQIFFNDWFNTKDINDILLGDQAMTLKNAVDKVKRAKMQNAAGPNTSAMIVAPELGINHLFNRSDSISLLAITDPEFVKRYGVITDESYEEGGEVQKGEGEKADAQMWMTPKAFRYMWFGLGKLTRAQAALLDKVEKGEQITANEAFSSMEKGTEGYIALNAMLNSKKLVYGDGTTYLKMSAFVLTRELTSTLNKKGEWIPLPHRVELHNLLNKLERYEEETDTVGIAAPESAIKMLKSNIVKNAEGDMVGRAFSQEPIEDNATGTGLINNITPLDPAFMRLQQVNPSNKLELVDPTQIKALISSEQDESKEVIIAGKKYTIGEVREMYHKSIADRVTIKYINKRNLIFNFPNAMDELHESIKLGRITANLFSFLTYAQVSLKSAAVKTQMLEFFEKDQNGEQKYDLNAPMTVQKFEELFMSYFSKGILREKIPGHTVALASDKGMKVIKKVIAIDEKTGQPSRWEVIRTDVWKNMESTPDIRKETYDDPVARTFAVTDEEGTFIGLEEGDIYIDELRANVPEYGEDGELTGDTYSEFMLPPHFKSVYDHIMVTEKHKSKETIEKEYQTWINEESWSPRARRWMKRKDFFGKDFNDLHARKDFASRKDHDNYVFNEITGEFEDFGNPNPEAIPNVVSKMFGSRIPGQDKHSAINLKMVDFLPVHYGSSGVFPEDLIEISGADFDIDKLFIHGKEFYNVRENFYEYGKGVSGTVPQKEGTSNLITLEEGYSDYIRYTLKQAQKKGSSIFEAVELWNSRYSGKRVIDEGGVIDNYLTKSKIKELIGPKPAEDASHEAHRGYNDAYNALFMQSLFQFAKEKPSILIKIWKKLGKNKSRGSLMGAMEILHLPITFAQYKSYREKFKREPYEGALNNDVLDAKYALLGNSGMTEPQHGRRTALAFEPAVVDPLVEIWNEIKVDFPELARSVDESTVDPDNMLGKLRAWANNKAGARSIGAVVLPNIVVNMLAEHGIRVRSQVVNGVETLPQIEFNGHTYNDFNTQFEIDPSTGKEMTDKFRTQYIISALVTAMTDNAKERLAAKLGLNKDALAVTTNLVALGVGIKTAILMINTPTIKESYFRAINKTNPRDPGVTTIIGDTIGRIKKYTASQQKAKEWGDSTQQAVTDEVMSEQIRGGYKATFEGRSEKKGGLDEYTQDDAEAELAVLEMFLNAHRLKTYTRYMTGLIQLHEGVGRDTAEIDEKEEDIAKLGIDLNDKDFNELEDQGAKIPIDVRKIFNGELGNWQSTFYEIYKEFTRELLPSVFMTRTPDFVRINSIMLANLTQNSFLMNNTKRAKLQKDLVSYLTIKSYMHTIKNTDISASLQNGLIYDQEATDGQLTIKQVHTRIQDVLDVSGPIDPKTKEPTRKPNMFMDMYMDFVSSEEAINNDGINILVSNTWTKMSDSQVVDLQNSFLEIYSNPLTHADAFNIMHYLIVKDGLQYKVGTIMDAIPPVIFDQFLHSVEQAHESLKLETRTDAAFIDTFGSTLPEIYNEFVTGYLESFANRGLLQVKNKPKIFDPGVASEVEIRKSKYNIDTVKATAKNKVYVFGDNIAESGVVGPQHQQSIRYEPNALRIRLKHTLTSEPRGFFTEKGADDDVYVDEQILINMIDEDIDAIIESGERRTVVFPTKLMDEADLAKMKKFSPKIYAHVAERLMSAFGYKLQGLSKAQIKSQTTAQAEVFMLHEGDKELVIDVYTGIGTINTKKGRNVKEVVVGKKRWLEVKKQLKAIKENLETLRKSYGFGGVGTIQEIVRTIDQQVIVEIGMPLELKVDMRSYKEVLNNARPNYRYFKLKKLWSSREAPKTAGTGAVDFIAEDEYMAYGNRAVYEEFVPVGTTAQSNIGFVTGSRPTWDVIREQIKKKNEVDEFGRFDQQAQDHFGGQAPQDGTDAPMVSTATSQTAAEHAVGVSKDVSWDGKNMKVDGTNVADVAPVPDKADSDTQEEAPEVGDVTPPEGMGTSLEALKQAVKLSSGVAPIKLNLISEFWNGLTGPQKLKLAQTEGGGLGINSEQGLIDLFNTPDSKFNEEEFADWLKSCIL